LKSNLSSGGDSGFFFGIHFPGFEGVGTIPGLWVKIIKPDPMDISFWEFSEVIAGKQGRCQISAGTA